MVLAKGGVRGLGGRVLLFLAGRGGDPTPTPPASDGGSCDTAWYTDADGDGHGAAEAVAAACEAPAGAVGQAGDCDDDDAAVHPGAAELCNAVDDDCDDPTLAVQGGDCDDDDGDVHPGAVERCADGVDDDCDGEADEDCPTCTVTVPDDVATVQGGLDLAQDADVVCVRAGTYDEELDFHGKAVTLVGLEGADATVLDGGGAHRLVSFTSDEGPDSVLDGFTLTDGRAEYGACVLIDGASPLEHVRVVGNVAYGTVSARGGGVYVQDADATLRHAIIAGNGVQADRRRSSALVFTGRSTLNRTGDDPPHPPP